MILNRELRSNIVHNLPSLLEPSQDMVRIATLLKSAVQIVDKDQYFNIDLNNGQSHVLSGEELIETGLMVSALVEAGQRKDLKGMRTILEEMGLLTN